MITSIITKPALTQEHLFVHIVLQDARFCVLTAALIKIQFFWYLTLSNNKWLYVFRKKHW